MTERLGAQEQGYRIEDLDDDEDLDDEEDDFMRWSPKWLHRDCASVCLALELGTCCMFPASTLVADLAGLGRNQLFQLICPVEQIAGALAEVCIYGFDEESMPEIAQRRPMLMPVQQLAEELGIRLWAAVRARLGITLADTA